VAKDGSRRKTWDGLGTALLALMLAVVIWVNATYQSDSPREDWFQESVPIEILNKPSGLTITSQPEKYVNVRIKAFNSSWTTLKASNFRAVADLKGLDEAGAPKPIPINVTCSDRTVTNITTQPETVYIQLEKFQKKAVEVQPVLQDVSEVPLGYVVGLSEVEPQFVSVEGPASAVDRVAKLVVTVSLAGQRAPIERQIKPEPVDAEGEAVEGVALTLNPDTVTLRCDIQKKSNYREVAVRPRTKGNPALGYFVSGLEVSPATITVIGPPSVIADMGGLMDVSGEVDLTGATRNLVEELPVDLPEGVSVVGAPEGQPYNVTIRVSIEAVTGGSTLEIPLATKKLQEGLEAKLSVPSVDVILTGPSVLLEELRTSMLDAYVDVGGLGVGTHQVKTQVTILVDKDARMADLRVTNVSPEFVEVTIKEPGTPTPTLEFTPTLDPIRIALTATALARQGVTPTVTLTGAATAPVTTTLIPSPQVTKAR